MHSRRFPSFSQWKQLLKVITGKERSIFFGLVVVSLASFSYLSGSVYLENTVLAPSYGGSFTEGAVGQPRFINPLYGETNDIDRSLVDLTYAGIMTYDKDGAIIPDLVKSYTISADGTIYTFQLKEDLVWQDGEPLTADDVIYTIRTIQNSDYKSPLRANWLNVEVAKISETEFAFALHSPYNAFLEICTVKIIPEHVWRHVLPENFTLSSYNLQPIGSGPYIVKELNQNRTGFITSIELAGNSRYHGKRPYIPRFTVKFFNDKDALAKAATQESIDGFALSTTSSEASPAGRFADYHFSMPRYFAVFFNAQKPRLFADASIAKALSHATDKTALQSAIKEESGETVRLVSSPTASDYFGYAEPAETYPFDPAAADALLAKAGYKKDANGTWIKANTKQPAFQFKSYLKQGSKGSEVSELQSCLARLDESFKTALAGDVAGTYGLSTENAVTAFQQKFLPEAKPTGETGPGSRQKLNELCFTRHDDTLNLQFTLKTVNQPQLVSLANLLKEQWAAMGITATVEPVELSDLKEVIKQRNYDALLYGQALGTLPDLYPFWHSTQINDPGLNLAAYQNKTADQLLKDAREALDDTIKIQKYEQLQEIIAKDAPAIFLYNPDYVYRVSRKIQGIETTKIVDPAKRFANAANWFINTKRVWK